ncbi:hypothetical protein [Vibrio sp. WXL210]|uniref:sialidase family protein n=1 Tax=Vibrio sp. WXL210 TaxID=3450709 RepID=UPI003EC79D6F
MSLINRPKVLYPGSLVALAVALQIPCAIGQSNAQIVESTQTASILENFIPTQEEGIWRQVAPGMAGSNKYISVDSVDPNKVWVSPDMGNDYLSLNGGQHWRTMMPEDGVWSQRNRLSDVYIASDPKNTDVVVGLKGNTIQLSTDGGIVFEPIRDFASGKQPRSTWYTAHPHPTETGTWYVANGLDNKDARNGVELNPMGRIDVDSPKVWKVTNITSDKRAISPIDGAGMDAESAVFDVFVHPDVKTHAEMVFAATSTGFYRKSADSEWVKLIDGPTKATHHWSGSELTVYVLQQATYEIEGDNLISHGAVFKTSQPETVAMNGWEDKTANLYVDLTQLSYDNTLVNLMAQRWFKKSKDEINSLTVPNAYFQNFIDILVDPTDPDRAYLSTWGGRINKPVPSAIWSTSNGGESWEATLRLGVGFQEDKFWQTAQPGRTNRNVDLQVHGRKFPDSEKYGKRGVRTMSIAPDGTLYASAVKGYFTVKYDPQTDFWTSVDNTRVEDDIYYGHGNADTGAFSVVPDPHRPGEMLLLAYELSAWRATTQTHPDFPGIVGVTPIPALIDAERSPAHGQPFYTPTTIAPHPTDPDVIYALSQRTGELYKVSENGTKLEVISVPIFVPETNFIPDMKVVYWSDLRVVEGGKTMYAVAETIDLNNRPMGQAQIFNPDSQKGVYKSSDYGKTWVNVNQNIPKTAGGRDLKIDPTYVKVDGEYSPPTRGKDSAPVKSLVVDPNNDEMLYAAVRQYYAPEGQTGRVDGGLYITTNGASSWKKAGIPATIKSVWDMWVHADQNGEATNIYLAAGDRNAIEVSGEGGLWVAQYKADGNYEASDWKKVFDHPFVSAVRTSPFDEDSILVVTRETASNGKQDAGTFYTVDGGKPDSWVKFNTGRGGMMVGKVAFDNGTPNRVWSAAEASGIYTALLPKKLAEKQ